MKTHPFITVIGNVGSGKSTISASLAKKMGAHHIAADELYKTNPFFPLAVKDRPRWSLTSDIWFLDKRVNFAIDIEKILTTKSVVQDSGLLMSWVYANSRITSGYMTETEFSLYANLYNALTINRIKESLVVYLHAPIDTLLARIKQRGRAFEIHTYSSEYLSSIQASLEQLLHQLHENGVSVMEHKSTASNSDESDLQQGVLQAINKQL